MLLFSLLFGLLVVAGAAMLLRAFRGRRAAAAGGPPARALDILDMRYARGEIDRDEFEERRSTLAG